MKEMSEIRANQLAKQLIEDQKDIDASNNISFVLATVLPLVKPHELQQQVYELLTEASASFTATQAKLSATLQRVQQLTEASVTVQEITEQEAEAFQGEEQKIEEAQEVEHEPS